MDYSTLAVVVVLAVIGFVAYKLLTNDDGSRNPDDDRPGGRSGGPDSPRTRT